MRTPYKHEPRLCTWCDEEYTPTGSRQYYCVGCKESAYRAKKLVWWREWWKKKGKQYDRNYKRIHRRSPHTQAEYTTNDIVEKTDFLDMIRKRIRAQKGDMLSVKKIVRYVLGDMGIESVSFGAKKTCYRATENLILDEFNGICYGISDYGGIVFKLPKERMR